MTEKTNNNLINGIAADFLHINDRAIHYGDGLFETILCYNNQLCYWQEHFQRLFSSAKKLQIVCPEEHVLLQDIDKLLAEQDNARQHVYAIKIILSRGLSERGYKFTKKIRANRIVSLSMIDAAYSSLVTKQLLSGDLFLCEQQASINENLAGLKHLNRLENVLARNEWADTRSTSTIIDGLMLNANQYIIEGTMSNVFAVKNKTLYTPDLMYSGINGIMRDVIMASAIQANIITSIVNVTLNDFLAMDEVFICNSLIGIKSVNNLLNSSYQQKEITESIFYSLLSSMDRHTHHV